MKRYYALVSGGKDSVSMAHYLKSRGELAGVVHLDTTIAAPDVQDFLRTLDEPLEIYKTPLGFEDTVRAFGFARPPSHQLYVDRLKGRGIRAFKHAHEGEDCVLLGSGVRKYESKRRMRNARPEGEWEGVKVEAPIFRWRTEQVWEYVRKHDLKLSPCYRTLHYSGDCFCGAYAEPNEKSIIKIFYPEVYERILKLEEEMGSKWGAKRIRYRALAGYERLACGSDCMISQSRLASAGAEVEKQ